MIREVRNNNNKFARWSKRYGVLLTVILVNIYCLFISSTFVFAQAKRTNSWAHDPNFSAQIFSLQFGCESKSAVRKAICVNWMYSWCHICIRDSSFAVRDTKVDFYSAYRWYAFDLGSSEFKNVPEKENSAKSVYGRWTGESMSMYAQPVYGIWMLPRRNTFLCARIICDHLDRVNRTHTSLIRATRVLVPYFHLYSRSLPFLYLLLFSMRTCEHLIY